MERISRRTARNALNPEGSVGRLWAIPFHEDWSRQVMAVRKFRNGRWRNVGMVVPLEVLAGPHRLVPTFLSDPWDQGNGLWRNAKPGVVRSPLEVAQAS
jgi:hypothetical protein